MCVDWYVRPMCAGLLRACPEANAVYFSIRAGREGPATHAFFLIANADQSWPAHPLPLPTAVSEVRQRLFGYSGPDILDSYSFSIAFRPCCRWDGAWTPFVIVRRRNNLPELEGMGTLHRREENWDPGLSLPVANRTVDQTLDELMLLDASAQILFRMEQVLETMETLPAQPAEQASLDWSVKYLEWVLGSV